MYQLPSFARVLFTWSALTGRRHVLGGRHVHHGDRGRRAPAHALVAVAELQLRGRREGRAIEVGGELTPDRRPLVVRDLEDDHGAAVAAVRAIAHRVIGAERDLHGAGVRVDRVRRETAAVGREVVGRDRRRVDLIVVVEIATAAAIDDGVPILRAADRQKTGGQDGRGADADLPKHSRASSKEDVGSSLACRTSGSSFGPSGAGRHEMADRFPADVCVGVLDSP